MARLIYRTETRNRKTKKNKIKIKTNLLRKYCSGIVPGSNPE